LRLGSKPRPRLPLWTGKLLSREEIPPQKEYQLQIQIVDLLRLAVLPGWEWAHIPNGELRDKRTAARLQAMGVKPGWPDLIFLSPMGAFHGLELKRRGKTLSDEQKAFHARARARGWPIQTADTFDGALAVLRAWGAIGEGTR
jgi:hypothetical protein